jgi:GxxExxY protein
MLFTHPNATTKKYVNDLTYQIIGAAIEVHRYAGPSLLESVYQKFLEQELQLRNINFLLEQQVPLNYKGTFVSALLRYDFLVEDLIVVELKAVEEILPIHEAQLLSYMKLLSKPKGILINFHSINIWKEGQKTFVNEHFANLPE